MLHFISNDISLIFMKDIVTESRIPYNTRSTVKVEQDTSRDLKCTKKSNFEPPWIKTVSYMD